MDILKPELIRMRERFTRNMGLWSRVSDSWQWLRRMGAGARKVRSMEGPGLERAERTLWLEASQWSSGSAEEASRVEGRGRGHIMWSQKNSRGGEKEDSTGQVVIVCVCALFSLILLI